MLVYYPGSELFSKLSIVFFFVVCVSRRSTTVGDGRCTWRAGQGISWWPRLCWSRGRTPRREMPMACRYVQDGDGGFDEVHSVFWWFVCFIFGSAMGYAVYCGAVYAAFGVLMVFGVVGSVFFFLLFFCFFVVLLFFSVFRGGRGQKSGCGSVFCGLVLFVFCGAFLDFLLVSRTAVNDTPSVGMLIFANTRGCVCCMCFWSAHVILCRAYVFILA